MFNCLSRAQFLNIPHLNTHLKDGKDKYVYFQGKLVNRSNYCVLSFCAGKKVNSFIQLTNKTKSNRISLCSVYLRDGGDCANPDCLGHRCDKNCPYHSWVNKNGKRENIFDNPHAKCLLSDRNDLLRGENVIFQYKDWGTAKNRCPHCGYKYQKWYLAWKENINKWKTTNQKGIVVIMDTPLGEGQRKEICYLRKKNYSYQTIKFSDYQRFINKI